MQLKIGIEVHGYIFVDAKLFCNCRIDAEASPNTTICPVCTSQPGSKPMLPNKDALDRIIAIAQFLGCSLNSRLLFQRKHYSWPDLPSGYQRTISGTYSSPVGVNGNFLGIGIEEVHLEEDPARWDPETGFVDYNRSGYPLVEIVTKPDFTSAEQVREWLKRLITTLGYIRAVNPDSGIKCDVNISISPDFSRVEVKNVNSLKSIVSAINYEAKRQEKLVSSGRRVELETRAWVEQLQETVFMRKKELAMDYMFIPEPDLPAIHVSERYAASIRKALPEKPHEKMERYIGKLRIDRADAEILSSEILLADLFERVAAKVNPVLAARWLRRELLRVLNYNKKELQDLEFDESHIIQLLRLVEQGRITDEVGKKILEKLADKPFDVEAYVKDEGLLVLSDVSELERLCDEAVNSNRKAVSDYMKGEEKALNFIVGQVIARTKGRADPRKVREIILSRVALHK
ncbi:Asp-tRNA(Asn)/Glu-tRNA(Gln) amidotransferase subunit GatB [Candidatus Woesearchaeota archaeon]|nr:Asp-tRNA(Asn)/Glu-tRNA(Gln) amidotransferase subunit GatB [Candidatus Woesearchaeota archaeon]